MYDSACVVLKEDAMSVLKDTATHKVASESEHVHAGSAWGMLTKALAACFPQQHATKAIRFAACKDLSASSTPLSNHVKTALC